MSTKPETLDPKIDDDGCCENSYCPSADLADQLKALGHPARMQIVAKLHGMERSCCGDVCECLPLAQSTVSQHIDVLKKAGLIIARQEGTRSLYSLNHDAFRRVSEALAKLGFSPSKS